MPQKGRYLRKGREGKLSLSRALNASMRPAEWKSTPGRGESKCCVPGEGSGGSRGSHRAKLRGLGKGFGCYSVLGSKEMPGSFWPLGGVLAGGACETTCLSSTKFGI